MHSLKKVGIAAIITATSVLPLQAQSITDIFNLDNISKAVNSITGKKEAVNLIGAWNYTGSAVEFESSDLLRQAGGTVASLAVENKMNTQLAKVGIKPGTMNFTFNADSTFTSTVGKRTMSGSYSYNASTGKVTLKYLKLLGTSAKVDYSSGEMALLFDADKLLKILAFMGSKSTNTTLKTVSSIAKTYDGMLLGFDMKKNNH